MVLLLLSGLALRLFCAADGSLHLWDERYHALVALHLHHHPLLPTLYEHPLLPYDFRDWSSNAVWLHKPPLPLWVMAGSLYLFGDSELPLRLPGVLLGTLAIGLTYDLGRRLFNRRVGFLAAFLLAVNGLIIECGAGRVATDHPDLFFLFFTELTVWLGVLAIQKRRALFLLLSGLTLGLAILSKWLPALVVLPVLGLLAVGTGQYTLRQLTALVLLFLACALAVVLPWELYIYHTFPREAAWEASFNWQHLGMVLNGQGGPWWYYIHQICINYGEYVYLPLLWFGWMMLKQKGQWVRWALAVWLLLPLLFFSAAQTKMQGYLLFTAPAIFLVTAVCWDEWIGRWRPGKAGVWLGVLLLLIPVLALRYMVERVKPFSTAPRTPPWVADLKKLPEDKTGQTVLFNYPRPVEAMFYTGYTVYSWLPAARTLDSLQSQGYKLWVYKSNMASPRGQGDATSFFLAMPPEE